MPARRSAGPPGCSQAKPWLAEPPPASATTSRALPPPPPPPSPPPRTPNGDRNAGRPYQATGRLLLALGIGPETAARRAPAGRPLTGALRNREARRRSRPPLPRPPPGLISSESILGTSPPLSPPPPPPPRLLLHQPLGEFRWSRSARPGPAGRGGRAPTWSSAGLGPPKPPPPPLGVDAPMDGPVGGSRTDGVRDLEIRVRRGKPRDRDVLRGAGTSNL